MMQIFEKEKVTFFKSKQTKSNVYKAWIFLWNLPYVQPYVQLNILFKVENEP